MSINLSGSYIILLDGEEVCRSKNLITTVGKTTIKQFMVGAYPSWASALGIGTQSTAVNTSDTKLGYEIDRREIVTKSLFTPTNSISTITTSGTNTALFTTRENVQLTVGDTVTVSGVTGTGITGLNTSHTVTATTSTTFTVTKTGLTNGEFAQTTAYAVGEETILLKAVFPDTLSAVIREVGVFSTIANTYSGQYNNKIISDFSEEGWSATGSLTPLVGTDTVLASTTSQTLSNISNTIDGYSPVDKLYLLINNPLAVAKTLTITLGNSSSSQSFAFSIPATAGSQVVSLALGTLTISSISYITVSTSTGTVELDALSVVNFDEYGAPDNMVSRSVLSANITKTAGQQLEIEYSMRIA